MTSFAPGVIAPRLHRKLQDWASERRGAVAVEFALIAIPFFFIVFGLLEVCLLFIMSTVLEHSISEASREIRTGQAQEAGFSEQDFRDAICSELFGLLDCGSNLHIDVRKLSGFGSASTVARALTMAPSLPSIGSEKIRWAPYAAVICLRGALTFAGMTKVMGTPRAAPTIA